MNTFKTDESRIPVDNSVFCHRTARTCCECHQPFMGASWQTICDYCMDKTKAKPVPPEPLTTVVPFPNAQVKEKLPEIKHTLFSDTIVEYQQAITRCPQCGCLIVADPWVSVCTPCMEKADLGD